MSRPQFGRGWYVVLLIAILVGLFPLTPAYATAGSISPVFANNFNNPNAYVTAADLSGERIIVPNGDSATRALLKSEGASQLVDYGAFSLWSVKAGSSALASVASAGQGQNLNRISLRDGSAVNTRESADRQTANLPANLRQSKTADGQFWLVQFAGPLRPDWLDGLRAENIQPVIYMPENAYVVWANGKSLAALENMAKNGQNFVKWTGEYHPAYRLEPALSKKLSAAGNNFVDVTVQVYTTPQSAQTLARLRGMGGKVLISEQTVLNFTNLTLQVPAAQVANIAAWADVFNIESWNTPRLLDERQGQFVAGNLTANGNTPSGTGYLTWITNTKGFSTNPANYPLVDVVDGSIDDGDTTPAHPDFHVNGTIGAGTSRVTNVENCTAGSTTDDVDGHGTLVAGIIAAYNNKTGAPHQDANNYRRGLGISPFGRIASTKIFTDTFIDLSACGNYAGVVAKSADKGALISNNSWGMATGGGYTAADQAYDALTRDALSGTAGNQQILHVFAAGNDGLSGNNTTYSPGNAKNVVSVGSNENVRTDESADGCNEPAISSDNFNDLFVLSSRGPTDDGRNKPDAVAPGVKIQGQASQSANYNGKGLCNAVFNKYYPETPVQTLYVRHTSTSIAAAATSGALSLIYTYYKDNLAQGAFPSPALGKALLINSTRYLTSTSATDALPSNGQGFGGVNLALFTSLPASGQTFFDQSSVFSGTGQQWVRQGTIADNTRPLRITLAWTDAPGSTTGASYVNDLNLEVRVGGQVYRGNNFGTTGSSTNTIRNIFDAKNNVESVFIPAGVSGSVIVTVTAANIAGDGVPGNGTALDQDFALAVFNGNTFGVAPETISQRLVGLTQVTGDGDNVVEPSETFDMDIEVGNFGNANITGVTGALTTSTANVTIDTGAGTFGDLSVGQSITQRYRFTVGGGVGCSGNISFSHVATFNGGTTATYNFTVPIGQANSTSTNAASTNVPLSITTVTGDNITVNSTLNVGTTGAINKITVSVNITHTNLEDLDLILIAPDATQIRLVSDNGGNGQNYTNTVFDEAAPLSIYQGTPPYTGSFKPQQALNLLTGKNRNGTWTLRAIDDVPGDVTGYVKGRILGWSITFVDPAANATCNTLVQNGYNVLTTDSDSTPEPGETVSVTIGVRNAGSAVGGVTGVLSSQTPGVTVVQGTFNYGSFNAGQIVTNTATPYRLQLDPSFGCGNLITLTHTVTNTLPTTKSFSETIVLRAGTLLEGTSFTVASEDVPKNLPAITSGVTSTLSVADSGKLSNLKVRVNLSHASVGDLRLKLVAPDNSEVLLFNKRGGSNANLTNLVLDDAALTALADGSAPFTGSFRPEQPLGGLFGKEMSGTWRLVVSDDTPLTDGTLNSWSLEFTPGAYVCSNGSEQTISVAITGGNPQSARIGQPFAQPLSVQVRNAVGNPVANAPLRWNVPPTGASATLPNGLLLLRQASNVSGNASIGVSANNTVGTYPVTVTVGTVAQASFSLTNLPPCTPLTVDLTTDDGTGSTCGTLSFALNTAAASANPVTITLSTAITISGGLPTVTPTAVVRRAHRASKSRRAVPRPARVLRSRVT
jgi:subtilisin-like proprotein convertase family protein